MDDYKIIVEQEHSTVMAHYDIPQKDAEGYQSEAKLEAAFIKQLQSQGYEYVKVKDEAGLLVNLRRQLELLNDVTLSETEWMRLLPMISNEQMTILDKFEASIQNLEAQLSQREKQYEYYRNKLLTFE